MTQIEQPPLPTSQAEISPPEASHLNVTAPRSLWFDAFLLLATLGIYTPFLWVGNIRDFKKLSNNNAISPWLWFFSAHIALVQCFALPKLNRMLSHYESALGLKPKQLPFRGWVALSILASLMLSFSNRSDVSNWFILVALLVYIVAMLSWIYRMANLKRADTRLSQYSLKKTHWWEWLIGSVGAVLVVLVSGVYSYETLSTKVLESYDNGSVFESKHGELSFPMTGSTWQRIEHENPEVLHSFQAFKTELVAYVYEYSSQRLNTIAKGRYGEILSWNAGYRCAEEQNFAESYYARAFLKCQRKGLWGFEQISIVIIDTGEMAYELYIVAEPIEESAQAIFTAVDQATVGFSVK